MGSHDATHIGEYPSRFAQGEAAHGGPPSPPPPSPPPPLEPPATEAPVARSPAPQPPQSLSSLPTRDMSAAETVPDATQTSCVKSAVPRLDEMPVVETSANPPESIGKSVRADHDPESAASPATSHRRLRWTDPPTAETASDVAVAAGASEVPPADHFRQQVAQSAGQEAAEYPTDPVEDDSLEVLVKNAPPWLASSIFHMLLLIILALIALGIDRSSRVELDATYAEDLGKQLDNDVLDFATEEVDVKEPIWTPEDLLKTDDPLAKAKEAEPTPNALLALSPTSEVQVGLALSGRQEGMKRALLAAYGGTETTEEAVMRGLRWLERNQRPDGSWSLKGPYADGASGRGGENRVAATAMALLAFQGAGYTHRGGRTSPFKDVVARGWDWLLRQQDGDGCFFHEGGYTQRFYTQGQCTIALCELYAMTRDEQLRGPAERAVAYCVKNQFEAGGWRYTPKEDSDLSVTGWVVMGLQSAKMAGVDVPYETWQGVERFLDLVSKRNGRRYAYLPGYSATPAMTAEGLLCRQYLGWWRDNEKLQSGVQYLLDNPMEWDDRNVYYWYYATQVCHHMEGDIWRKWNEVMRQMLPAHQERHGRDHGSWSPRGDRFGGAGGRLYVTCLSIYMLEVYYRHLPIYQYQLFDAAPDGT